MTPVAEAAFDALIRRLAEERAAPKVYADHIDPTGWRRRAEVIKELGELFGTALCAYLADAGLAEHGELDHYAIELTCEKIADRVEAKAEDWEDCNRPRRSTFNPRFGLRP